MTKTLKEAIEFASQPVGESLMWSVDYSRIAARIFNTFNVQQDKHGWSVRDKDTGTRYSGLKTEQAARQKAIEIFVEYLKKASRYVT